LQFIVQELQLLSNATVDIATDIPNDVVDASFGASESLAHCAQIFIRFLEFA
jgi:hypothetical protein